jgi:hypothetical protein
LFVEKETVGMADVSRVEVPGPLGPFAAGFVEELVRQGFMPVTVGKHVALLAGLSGWLAAEGVAPPASAPACEGPVEELLSRFRRYLE